MGTHASAVMTIDPEGHELTALLAHLPSPAGCRVVEIGCGSGRLTRRYASHVESVLAIDADAQAVAAFRAAGLPPGVDARALTVDRLDLPDECCDAVLLSWAL